VARRTSPRLPPSVATASIGGGALAVVRSVRPDWQTDVPSCALLSEAAGQASRLAVIRSPNCAECVTRTVTRRGAGRGDCEHETNRSATAVSRMVAGSLRPALRTLRPIR
jgi:hypothetical protein